MDSCVKCRPEQVCAVPAKRWLVVLAGTALALVPAYDSEAVTFTDVTTQAGIAHTQWRNDDPSLPFREANHMSGGAAAGDFDGDGWVDLFVTRLDDTDLLYRNRGDGTFEDVSAAAGFTQTLPTNGAVWGDLDNDGDQDLYVTAVRSQRNYLYVNNGAGGFSEQAIARGADVPSVSEKHRFSAAVGDYDRDGFLDIHTTDWGSPLSGPGGTGTNATRLLRNQGTTAPANFSDATLAAGVDLGVLGSTGLRTEAAAVYAFASRFSDLDGDGIPDLVIAGDFNTSRLFWGEGNGTFTDGGIAAGVSTDENGMGLTVGDYNGDGRLDVFITSIYDPDDTCGTNVCNWGNTGNRLYRNQGGRSFADVTGAAGVHDGGWGWGTTFLDFDNDGDLDLVSTNGIRFSDSDLDAQFENDAVRLWRNEGGPNPVYIEVATLAGVDDTGSGKGLLTFDFDRDGDLDLFIVNNNAAPVLYRNDSENSNAWLQIETIGTESNRDGIGTRITVVPDLATPDVLQVREIDGGSNFLAQNETIAHFGLGGHSTSIDLITIQWPSGRVQQLFDVATNQQIVVTEPVPEASSLALLSLAFLLVSLERTDYR